jgi:thiamine biosynthesis lipoprotein
MTSVVNQIICSVKYLSLQLPGGIFLLALVIAGCSPKGNESELAVGFAEMTGNAQGTTYSIKYDDKEGRNLQADIDSLLLDFDWHLSTYSDSSLISDFNRADVQYYCQIVSNIMAECVKLSRTVYMRTDKAFNPAVYPLVSLWGFYQLDDNEGARPTQQQIDSILEYISFDESSIQLVQPGKDMEGGRGAKYIELCKTDNRAKLDFDAIAQGYSVDLISKYFMDLGIENFMVELGGEVRCKGVNAKGNTWTIGIDRPIDRMGTDNRELSAQIKLHDMGLATSGNYRKFYEKDGVKYSHTIDPITGKPVTHSLLSVTVVSHEAAVADAYATAFMVMGVEKTKLFLEKNNDMDLEVYLVFCEEDGSYSSWISEGMNEDLTEF